MAVGPGAADLPQGHGRRRPDDVNDLFDPKFKGKVTFLTEMRDSVGSVLLADGHQARGRDQGPGDGTRSTRSRRRSKDGQIRRFTGNDYTQGHRSRATRYAILGWSGDAVQLRLDNKNVKFKQPDEGFMIFTDSMQIPVGAPHAFTAEKLWTSSTTRRSRRRSRHT